MYWTLKLDVRGGHRYFEAPDGRIAIADNSGQTPDTCEDKLLWLDRTRPVELGERASIPLIGDNKQQWRTGESTADGILVALTFGLAIYCGPYLLSAVVRQ